MTDSSSMTSADGSGRTPKAQDTPKILLLSSRPRSASVGRPRPLSATSPGAPLRPTLASSPPTNDWGLASVPRDVGSTRRSVTTASNRLALGLPSAAWVNPRGQAPGTFRSRSPGAGASASITGPRKAKVETLADMLATADGHASMKDQLRSAQEEANLAVAEKRRVEAELTAILANLEGLLKRDAAVPASSAGAANPQRRFHDKTVAALTQQLAEMQKERDAQAAQVVALQKSTRATLLIQLETELEAAQEEVQRLRGLLAQGIEATSFSEGGASVAGTALTDSPGSLGTALTAAAVDMGAMKQYANSSSISAGGVRRALQGMLQAHKMLIAQAALIRTSLTPGLSFLEFRERARHRSSTAGAPEVLNFLRNHVLKLNSELSGQPGVPVPSGASFGGSVDRVSASPRSRSASPVRSRMTSTALLESLSALNQQLQTTDRPTFRADAELQTSTEAVASVMQVCLNEVRRLQGLPPLAVASTTTTATTVTATGGAATSAAVAGKGPASVAAAAAVAAAAPPALVPYTVYIRTGDSKPSSFDGSLYLQLQGSTGDSSEVRLPGDKYSFAPGVESEYVVEAEDVGEVRSVSVRMEVAGEAGNASWHLQHVRLASLPANAGQGVNNTFVLEDLIKSGAKVQLFPRSALGPADYEVTVYTADSRGAGTDGGAAIAFVGDAGRSEWVPLRGRGDGGFARGGVDTFLVSAADVNDLSHVQLRLTGAAEKGSLRAGEDAALRSDWNVARVEVLHQGTGWKSVFYCNDWLSRMGDAKLLQEADTWVARSKYTLEVQTCDLNGADFEGRAYVTLSGYWGTTKEVKLCKPGATSHSFSSGGTETFAVMADDVGPITNMTLRIDAANDISDAWGLQEINVVCESSWYGGRFVHGGWLSASTPTATIWKYRDPATYKLSVFTSSADPGAAFDGEVYVSLTGAFGSTDELLLRNASSAEGPVGVPKTLYGGAAHQEFEVRATDVGNLTAVKVRIAATGTTSSWLLERIEVTPPPDTQQQQQQQQGQGAEGEGASAAAAPVAAKPCVFSHNAWVYPEAVVTLPKLLQTTEYQVKVETSQCSDNFDGDVYLVLSGLDGSSQETKLSNGKTANFYAGTVAEFVVAVGDVGQLSSATLRIDNAGSQPYWHLAKLEVTHSPTHSVGYFRYNGWLNAYWNTTVQLSSQSLFEYRVDVFDAPGGAGFQGDVLVQLQGNYSSDWIRLPYRPSTSPSATLSLKLSDLGTPYRVDVRLEAPDGSAPASGLPLDRVEVTNVTSGGEAWTYPNVGKAPIGAGGDYAYIARAELLTHSLELVQLSNLPGVNGRPGAPAPAFSGKAFVVLQCERGDSEELPLVDSEGAAPKLEPGASTQLTVRPYNLGKLKGVKVRCTGGRWPLDRLRVYNYDDWTTSTHYCGRVIELGSGWTTLEKLESVEYVVTISTEDVSGNGTDGHLHLTLEGDKGCSEEQRLWPDNSESCYERGATDRATFTVPTVGALRSIRIKLGAPGWWADLHGSLKLGEVTVLDTVTGRLSHFPINAWLQGVDQVVQVPIGVTESVFKQYEVAVYGSYSTVAEWGYDTRIKLKGDSGESRLLVLPASQATATDAAAKLTAYRVGTMDVGDLSGIDFGLSDDSGSAYMSIARVEVRCIDTSAYAVFPVQQYVYSWCGLSSFSAAPRDTSYNVEVTTASLTSAKGFDGSAYITLHGEGANSHEMKLENWWSSGFQSGTRSSFYLTSVNVGAIQAITLRTEDAAAAAASPSQWGVSLVEVTNNSSGSKAVCEWSKGYVQAGVAVRIDRTKHEADFEVHVHTGDVRGAGTDASLEIQFGGNNATSAWLPLDASKLLLEEGADGGGVMLARGTTDRFRVRGPADLGDGRWVSLRLSGDDVHSSWYLSSLDLLNTQSGLKSSFNFNSWLGAGGETTLQEATAVQTLVPYTVSVKTSDLRGSDFEGEAFIKINGYDACTEWMKLVKEGHSKSSFLRDETVTLTLNGCETGYIYSMEVKIVPSEADPNWNLDEVRVQKKGGDECVFQCGRWLDPETPTLSLSRWQDTVKYTITAHTSADPTPAATAAPAPAFEGRAYVVLTGGWGCTSETELVNDATKWAAGEAQQFEVEATDVGALQSVSLRVAPGASGQACSWTLDCVEVARQDGSQPTCIFKAAPSPITSAAASSSTPAEPTAEPTPSTPVTLSSGSDAVTLPKSRPMAEYRVELVTADAADSAFDGDVYLTLTGSDGTSDEVKLTNALPSSVNFGVSASSQFVLRMPDYGAARYLQLRADFTGTATNWILARVELLNSADGSKSLFAYNSYLNTSYTSTYLYPQSSYTCKVLVHTSDAGGPDFNGRAFLQLSTGYDSSAELQLVPPEGAFKAGSVQEFTFKTNLGYCNDATLRIEPVEGGATKWCVQSVELNFVDSCSRQFLRNKDNTWLTKAEPKLTLTSTWMSCYSVSLETSALSEPFDGALFLALVNTSADNAQESNEVSLPLVDGPLRPGSKVSIDSLWLASVDYNAVRIRAQPSSGAAASTWLPGTLELSGQLFVFDGGVPVPGSATAMRLPTCEYCIEVHASDIRGNGTDGDVSVVLLGDKVKTPETRLWLTGSQELERGKKSTANVSLPDVGAIKQLQLKLVDTGSGLHSQLHVDKVAVTHASSGLMTTFPVGAWISTSADDATLASPEGEARDVYVSYRFDVFSAAGSPSFDGEVQLKLQGQGEEGPDTGCLTLGTGSGDGNAGLFQSGAKDSFTLRCKDVGAPYRLWGNINYRNSCNSWSLSRVEVTNEKTGERKACKLGGCLYTWNWWTEVPALPVAQYQVSVTTANTSDATFDGAAAGVYLTLNGEDGSTGEVQLPLSPGDGTFAPSATDVLTIEAADVGRLSKAVLRLGRGGGKASWMPTCFNVTNLSSGLQAVFEYGSPEAVSPGDEVSMHKTVANVEYQVTMRTSDVRGAGTDGAVYLSLSGDAGITDEVLVTDEPANLARGSTFTFSFTGVEVGGARSATVRLAPRPAAASTTTTAGAPAAAGGSGAAAAAAVLRSGWHLASLDVLNMSTGVKGTFNHHAWLSAAGGAGSSAQLQEASSSKALAEYTVSVQTSEQHAADFDGKAWITVLGWYSQTAEMPLALPGRTTASFKAGETATFTLYGVDVGYVRAVNVRMEPTASDLEWCLDTISVTCNGSTSDFTYGNRLNKAKPSAEISQSQTLADFKVLVYTSDQSDAGFQGEMAIQLEGPYEYSKSELVPLIPDDGANAFAAASCREFHIKAADVGSIARLTVVATAPAPQRWHLDKLVLIKSAAEGSDAEPSEPVTFTHHAWVPVHAAASADAAASTGVSLVRDGPVVTWRVVVVTGDGDFAGDVFFGLQGSQSRVPEVKLTPDLLAPTSGATLAAATGAPASAVAPGAAQAASSATPGTGLFAANTSSAFLLPGPELGALSHATVRLEGSGTWFLERLEVTNTATGATTLFNYKSSISPEWGSTAYVYPQSAYTFKVVVVTSDVEGAGMADGDVYVKPIGSWSSGEEVKLVHTGEVKGFERGSRREFTISVNDVSYVTELAVRVEPKAVATKAAALSWHLDRIELSMDGGWFSSAYIHQGWLKGPDKLAVTLPMVFLHDWTAMLHTSKASEPFDGKVWVQLHGSDGEAGEKVQLEVCTPDPDAPAGGATFIPGGCVGCKFRAPAIKARLARATLHVDFPNGSPAKPWTLDRLELLNTWTSSSYAFYTGDCPLSAKKPNIQVEPRADDEYEVTVTTSDDSAAGTDGAVYATLVGKWGDSGEQQLATAIDGDAAQLFECGATNKFVISAKDLGQLKELTLRLTDGGSGVHSAWCVASAEVLHIRSGLRTTFPLAGWLQAEEHKTAAAGASVDTYVGYKVTVETADAEDAAFDGEVTLRLKGADGRVSHKVELALPGKADVFGKGATSQFVVRAADVGDLAGAEVYLNAAGNASCWKPQRVEVVLVSSGAKVTLAPSNADGLYYWNSPHELCLTA